MELLKIIFGVCFLVSGCATTEKDKVDPESLDIRQDSTLPALASVPKTTVVKPESVFHWQGYFKSPPTQEQRVPILQTIKDLEGAKSVIDLQKRARNEVAVGQYAAAEATYRSILRLERENLDAMVELATVYYRLHKVEECFQVLSDVKATLAGQEQPDKMTIFRYRYVLAMAHIARGDRERGHAILSDLIGIEKGFVPGYAALASSYLATGKEQVAKFIVERGLDRGRDDPSLYNLLGVIAERQGQMTAAKDNYNKAISLTSGFAPALVNRGNIYLRDHELSMAETDLKKALSFDPMNIEALISLAVVQRQTGRVDSARSTIERVLELSPGSPEARFNLAIIMKDNVKDQTEAIRLFSEVLQTEQASGEIKALARSAIDELKTLY